MGTFFNWCARSKRDIITAITQSYSPEEGVQIHTLRKCIRGNVLWVLHARVVPQYKTNHKFIACYLLRKDREDEAWGYKPLAEYVHPSYYSCPLSYLKQTTTGECEEWRQRVRAEANKRKARAMRRKFVEAGLLVG